MYVSCMNGSEMCTCVYMYAHGTHTCVCILCVHVVWNVCIYVKYMCRCRCVRCVCYMYCVLINIRPLTLSFPCSSLSESFPLALHEALPHPFDLERPRPHLQEDQPLLMDKECWHRSATWLPASSVTFPVPSWGMPHFSPGTHKLVF